MRDTGPYRFSHDMIKKIFENSGFKIQTLGKPFIRAH